MKTVDILAKILTLRKRVYISDYFCDRKKMHENHSFFTTSFESALDPHPVNPPFGILDLPSVFIKDIPVFTEESTLQAMEKLGIQPDELVVDDMSNYSGDSTMRMQISLDMEKQRIIKIQKIIKMRETIVNNSGHVKPQPKKLKNISRKQKQFDLNSTRRYPKNNYRSKSSARSTKSYDYRPVHSNVPINSKNDSTNYHDLGRIIQISRKAQENIIKEKAQIRLKQQKEEVALIQARRERNKAITQLELKKQAQIVSKLHEQKIKKYEEEMKWRLANIYKSGTQSIQHNKINAMRKNLKSKRAKSIDNSSVTSNDSLIRRKGSNA